MISVFQLVSFAALQLSSDLPLGQLSVLAHLLASPLVTWV